MTGEDKHALLAKAKQRRDAKVSAAEAEFAETVRSIERVWHLARGIEPGRYQKRKLTVVNAPVRPPSDAGPTALIRRAIEQAGETFTMPQLAEWLTQHHPESPIERVAISSALHKLMTQGEISQVQPGAGKTPATYTKNPTLQLGQSNERREVIVGQTQAV